MPSQAVELFVTAHSLSLIIFHAMVEDSLSFCHKRVVLTAIPSTAIQNTGRQKKYILSTLSLEFKSSFYL